MAPGKVNLCMILHVPLFIIRREFAELMEKYGSSYSTSSGSDISVSTGIFHYVYHYIALQE